jgi:thiol-disulfide isomerase/thioredoxin
MIAPEFPANLEWLNADRRYSIKDFKGKFILLDFWTYCCINCMHVIPELKKLEEKYPELIVIGVHSAKFHNEKVKDNIKQAALRYEIEHPIIIDNNFEIWKTYDIDSWPSFILIGPDRQIIGRASGEGIFERLDTVMEKLITIYHEAGKLNREPVQFALLKEAAPETFLRFPGKIEADSYSLRLFISDSNHHRILIVNPEGEVLDIIGSGIQGRRDDSFEKVEFFRPQGLAFDPKRGCLYIADTENHIIRRADLESRAVTTIAGSGEMGMVEGKGREASFSSPWDLTILGKHIYIAMAGTHQIWRMDPDSKQVEVYAGSGSEGVQDGPKLSASLAQPSGITTDGRDLYFADSEVSALRMIQEDVVTTLIGKGLFVFGDQDGLFPEARLQHPIGVHYHENALYIADSYNHKMKRADLRTREVTTLVGTGDAGRRDGDARRAGLNEPNDVAFLDGKFYIADTNNHAIRVFDPRTERLSTMSLGPVPLEGAEKAVVAEKAIEAEKPIVLTERAIPSKAKGIYFQLMLPKGYHWNELAEQQIKLSSENPEIVSVSDPTKKNGFSYYIPLQVRGKGRATLKVQIVGYYCDRGDSCCFRPAEFELPLRIEETAPLEEITAVYQLSP